MRPQCATVAVVVVSRTEGTVLGVRERFRAGLARQLGRPEGLRGRLVGLRLNKFNRGAVSAAVDATAVGPGQRAADIGFGGGVGLQLLLDRVGDAGHVDGVELSTTMLKAAERRYRAACAERRLTLHAGTLGELPLEDESLDGLITVNTPSTSWRTCRAPSVSSLGCSGQPAGQSSVAQIRSSWLRCRSRPMASGFDPSTRSNGCCSRLD